MTRCRSNKLASRHTWAWELPSPGSRCRRRQAWVSVSAECTALKAGGTGDTRSTQSRVHADVATTVTGSSGLRPRGRKSSRPKAPRIDSTTSGSHPEDGVMSRRIQTGRLAGRKSGKRSGIRSVRLSRGSELQAWLELGAPRPSETSRSKFQLTTIIQAPDRDNVPLAAEHASDAGSYQYEAGIPGELQAHHPTRLDCAVIGPEAQQIALKNQPAKWRGVKVPFRLLF